MFTTERTEPAAAAVAARRYPNVPELKQGQVHVWSIRVDDQTAMPAPLSTEEIARAERLKQKDDRRRYLLGRSVLRALLSQYAGVAATSLRFTYGAFGKPSLDSNLCEIQFNVSHSSELILIALTRDGFVGIDIERIDPATDVMALSKRFFTPFEQGQIDLSADSRAEFFKIWTVKEAYLKALGTGFSQQFTNVQAARDNSTNNGRCWSIFNIPTDTNYCAALALHAKSNITLESVSYFTWS